MGDVSQQAGEDLPRSAGTSGSRSSAVRPSFSCQNAHVETVTRAAQARVALATMARHGMLGAPVLRKENTPAFENAFSGSFKSVCATYR